MFDDAVRQVLAQQEQIRQATLAINQIPQDAFRDLVQSRQATIRALGQIPQDVFRAVSQIPSDTFRDWVQSRQATIDALSQFPQDTFRDLIQSQQDLFRGIQGSGEAIRHLGNSTAHMIESWRQRQQMEAEFIAKIGTTTVDVPIVPPQPVKPMARFPATWELFPFLLSRRIQRDVYEPVQEELLADWLKTRRYKGKLARRWITFCFFVRTAHAFILCLFECAREPAVRYVAGRLPNAFRRWWMQTNSGD